MYLCTRNNQQRQLTPQKSKKMKTRHSVKFLEAHVSNSCCVGGQFKITITYRGKSYTCTSNNTLAYDRISEDGYTPRRARTCIPYTYRGALEAMYLECLNKRVDDTL